MRCIYGRLWRDSPRSVSYRNYDILYDKTFLTTLHHLPAINVLPTPFGRCCPMTGLRWSVLPFSCVIVGPVLTAVIPACVCDPGRCLTSACLCRDERPLRVRRPLRRPGVRRQRLAGRLGSRPRQPLHGEALVLRPAGTGPPRLSAVCGVWCGV